MIKVTKERNQLSRSLSLAEEHLPEDDKNPLSFSAKGIPYGNTHIIKSYVCSSGSWWVTSFDWFSFHTRTTLDKDDSETIFRLATDREVISKPKKVVNPKALKLNRMYPRSIRNPFLRP